MIDTDFVAQVNAISGQSIELCYHCHKCTAGCPVLPEMTFGPDRILHMVQLGQRETLLSSEDIWLCASCETCGAHCPNDIDIAQVMDGLRQLALARDGRVGAPNAARFHRLFLALVRRLGRMHEASLLAIYLTWSRQLLGYVGTGARMFVKGKVPLRPHLIRDRDQLGHLFEAAERAETGAEEGSQ